MDGEVLDQSTRESIKAMAFRGLKKSQPHPAFTADLPKAAITEKVVPASTGESAVARYMKVNAVDKTICEAARKVAGSEDSIKLMKNLFKRPR